MDTVAYGVSIGSSLMFLCMFFTYFYNSEKTCFHVCLFVQINVFNIYALSVVGSRV